MAKETTIKEFIKKTATRILKEEAEKKAKVREQKLNEAVEFLKTIDLSKVKDKKQLKALIENAKKTLDFIEKTF